MGRRPPDEPGPVYAIADAAALAPTQLPVAVELLADAGVKWIQLRAKKVEDRVFSSWIEESCRRLEGSGVALWVDDRVDMARLYPVAGVHLGQRDLPAREARKLVGDQVWIGASTHNRTQILAAQSDEAIDVIAVGPIFPTASKENPDPVVGLDLIRWAKERTGKPLVAIGGIDADNLAAVRRAGADTGAVLGALCAGGSETLSTRARLLLAS